MGLRITWWGGIKTSNGIQVTFPTNDLEVGPCSSVQVDVPEQKDGGAAGAQSVEVDLTNGVLLAVNPSVNNPGFTYKVGQIGDAFDKSLLLVGETAVSLVGKEKVTFAFTNATTTKATVDIVVGQSQSVTPTPSPTPAPTPTPADATGATRGRGNSPSQ
jgi:hypothetical protein